MRRIVMAAGVLVAVTAVWACGSGKADRAPDRQGGEGERAVAGPRGSGGGGRGQGPGADRPGARRRGWGAAGSVVSLTADQEQALGVQTLTVAARPFRTTLRAMGEVTVPLPRKAIVSCPCAARIARVQVGVGAWVSRGQPVVTVLSDDVGLARTEYLKAQAAVELARRTYDREKQLYDKGVGAQKTLLAGENDLKMAETTRLAAERRLHVFGLSDAEIRILDASHGNPAELTLLAPIDGKVVDSAAVLGAMIDASSEILTVVDPRVLWVDADIYERDIAQIALGQPVAVEVPAYPGEVFEGTIGYIGDVVKPDTRTIAVRTEVPNPRQRLKPGMFANVVFRIRERADVLALPASAILEDGDAHLVFVRTASGYEPRLVELGGQDNGSREVVKGLARGDRVVVSGHYQLKSKLYEDVVKSGHSH